VALRFYDEAFQRVGAVKVSKAAVTVKPRRSYSAKLTSAEHGGPLSFELRTLTPPRKPATSKAVKQEG
jgi:hypothetical protein